jgi:hypothetical protein
MSSDVRTVLTSAGFSLLAAVLVAGVTELRYRTDRRRDQARRDAEVLGPVLVYLADMEPDRKMFHVPGEIEAMFDEMRELRRRLDAIRGPLLVLRAGHHNAQVRRDAQSLAVALSNVQTSTEWVLRDMIHHAASTDSSEVDRMRKDPQRATTLADSLLARIAPKDAPGSTSRQSLGRPPAACAPA